ncbi:MAG: sulfatase family protein [Candidatus Promineifilaceae bacterium]
MNRREFLLNSGLATLGALIPQGLREQSDDRPNVLMIVMDSLAAENCSLYGYPRDTTPHLNRIAERSTVFHRHYAGGNFTAPGTATLLTGSYPWSHRAVNVLGTVRPEYEQRNLFHLFKQADYHNIALAHTPLATVLLSQFSADIQQLQRIENLALFQDTFLTRLLPFDKYKVAFPSEMQYLAGTIDAIDSRVQPGSLFLSNLHRVWRKAGRKFSQRNLGNNYPRGSPNAGNSIMFLIEDSFDWWKAELPKIKQPFMAYYHCYAPHFPYTPHIDYIDHFTNGWKAAGKPMSEFGRANVWGSGNTPSDLNFWRIDYDRYLASADLQIGLMLDHLEAQGTLDNTIVVITADHGELFERGILGHTTPALYDPLTRIPLMISLPGQRQRQDIHEPTSAADVLPTMLALTGQTVPNWVEGEVLMPYNANPTANRPVFTVEAKNTSRHGKLDRRSVSVVQERYKLVHYKGYAEAPDMQELYDMEADSAELNNLIDSKPDIAAQLSATIEAHLRDADAI